MSMPLVARGLKLILLPFVLLPFLAAACGDNGVDSTVAVESGALSSNAAVSSAGWTIQSVAPARPVPTTDGDRHLVYELFFTNTRAANARIDAIEVIDPSCTTTVLARYAGDALARILQVDAGDAATGTVAAGAHAGAFFDLTQPRLGRLPEQLAHRITTGSGVVRGPTVSVLAGAARPVSPPLRGKNLIDLNGCCRSPHTGALLLADSGDLFVAQRYAIDFARLDDNGELYAGDPSKNESFFTYGADIIAATDGRIVAVRDGVAENIPTEPLPPATIESAPGNYVVEALADGRFALYAHMQPGNVQVQPGQHVRRGQVLGLVGNSGNSTGPHLHFHVTDGPSPLESNGVPYVFDHFDLQATVDLDDPDPEVVFVPQPQRRHNLLIMTGDIVTFP